MAGYLDLYFRMKYSSTTRKLRGFTVLGYFWESIIYLDMLVEVKRWHFRQLVTKFCCPQEEDVSVACTMVWKEGEIMYNCVAAEIFCFAILKRISCRRAMTKKHIFFCSYVRHRPPLLRMIIFFLSDFFPSNEINFQIGYWKVAQDK